MELAGDYLNCRATGADATPVARSAWEMFHAWADDRIQKFAGAYRARGVDVEDCAQETWMHVAAQLPDFRLDPSRGKFSTWLYAIVRSKAIDQLRRASRFATTQAPLAEVTAQSNGPLDDCIRNESLAAARSAMQKLQPLCSQETYRVLKMRLLEGKEVGEVADVLGLSPSQVWTREHRARRKLRKLMNSARAVSTSDYKLQTA